ncbi:MAG: hypothetical protein UY73_C0010G0002 [Parcubacteria group bacterium GW2011_GWA2_52_8]|nr:MAG: hypothetical protein UY73_C0010G0002 [Parcubacteria group bacterium GW2011_GWA2_52_8]
MGAKASAALSAQPPDYVEVLREVLNTFPVGPEQLIVILDTRTGRSIVCPIRPGSTRTFRALDPEIKVALDSLGKAHAVLGRRHATQLRDEEFTVLGDFEVVVFRQSKTAVQTLFLRM